MAREFAQFLPEVRADFIADARDEFVAFQNVEVREGGSGSCRMAAIRESVSEVAGSDDRLSDFITEHRRAERQVPAGDSFRQGHDVGIEFPKLAREPCAKAA